MQIKVLSGVIGWKWWR